MTITVPFAADGRETGYFFSHDTDDWTGDEKHSPVLSHRLGLWELDLTVRHGYKSTLWQSVMWLGRLELHHMTSD